MLYILGTVLFILLFLLGSVIFSFLNVVIYRLPRKENFITGRSHCPSCGHTLSFADMIPVFSWLALKKKCRYCGCSISSRYAIVETMGGIAALVSIYFYGISIRTVLAFLMCCFLTCVAFIDADTMEIPDGLNLAILIAGVIAVFTTDYCTWYAHVLGLLVISVPMLIIALIIPSGFGGGDIKLMAACGLYLGWINVSFAFFVAVVIGGVWALVMFVKGKKDKKELIPFGPFLCIGVIISMYFGETIMDYYINSILRL